MCPPDGDAPGGEASVSDVDFANAPETTDFDGLGGSFDEITADLTPPVETSPAAAPSPQKQPSVTQPVSTPAQAQTPPVVQPQTPPASPVAQPAVQPQTPDVGKPNQQPDGGEASTQPSAAGPEDFIAQAIKGITENEAQLVDTLAKQHFALNPAMVEALKAGQGATEFPRLFAYAHLRAMKSTMQMVSDLVPQMIEKGISKYRNEATQDSEFFRQYPQLNREKHGADIKALAKAYRSLNPNIKVGDLFAKIGPAVMASHGIVPTVTPAPVAGRPNGNAPPFVPAVGGRPPATSTQPAADSDSWGGLWSPED